MNELLQHARDLIGDPETVGFTALRVFVVYAVVLAGLRLSGPRLLGQLAPFDLVTLLLLSNAVQNAMIGPDNSLLGGILGASMLLILNRFVATNGWARARVEGHPVVLILAGVAQLDALRQQHVDLGELQTAVREHGLAHVEDVESAILEMDGTISVIGREHTHVKRLRKVRSARSDADTSG